MTEQELRDAVASEEEEVVVDDYTFTKEGDNVVVTNATDNRVVFPQSLPDAEYEAFMLLLFGRLGVEF